MAHPKAAPRVKGPYTERGGTRFRIRVCDGSGHRDMYFAVLKEALAAKERAERELPRAASCHRLAEVLDAYYQDKLQREQCKPQTAREQQARLAAFFNGYLDTELTRITPKRAAAIYEAAVEMPCGKTGQPPSAATHRFYLKLAQGLFGWAVRKGYLPSNPFQDVQPVGRVNRGKKQLRFEEASRFISTGLKMYDEQNDAMALAAVTALLLGCRASEVLHVRVRDLDCGGTKLWVAARDGEYRGKTENAARDPDVPDVLRPRLTKLAADKTPDDFLFGSTAAGKPRCRQVLHSAVRRVCVAAGVPVVCPHSLRGLWATAGVRSGALSHAVAAALGHGSFAVTAKHYVKPGAIDGARTERLVEMLDLQGSREAETSPPAAALRGLSAEQLLSQLPAETLSQLVTLLTASRRRQDAS